jgi:hypothetical protein
LTATDHRDLEGSIDHRGTTKGRTDPERPFVITPPSGSSRHPTWPIAISRGALQEEHHQQVEDGERIVLGAERGADLLDAAPALEHRRLPGDAHHQLAAGGAGDDAGGVEDVADAAGPPPRTRKSTRAARPGGSRLAVRGPDSRRTSGRARSGDRGSGPERTP